MPNRSRIVIGVAGRIGSGKSIIAHCLEHEFGFQYLRYSMVLADWYPTDPADKVRLQEVGGDVMAGDGQRELNRRLIERVQPNRDVAVDGLRHPIDYEWLKAAFGGCFFLIFVETPAQTRFDRCGDRYCTFEQFLAADTRPVESHIDSLQPLTAATIAGTLQNGELTSTLRSLTLSFRQRIGK